MYITLKVSYTRVQGLFSVWYSAFFVLIFVDILWKSYTERFLKCTYWGGIILYDISLGEKNNVFPKICSVYKFNYELLRTLDGVKKCVPYL